MLLNDVRTLLTSVQLQLSLYEDCHRVYIIHKCSLFINSVFVYLQFEVLAKDGGDPQKVGSAVVIVHVTRIPVSGPRMLGFSQPLYMYVSHQK